MGKLIDVNKWFKDTFPKADLDYSTLDNKKAYPHWSTDITGLVNILNDAESVEAITKDQYEARLKTDMVAMLTEIQLEIEEHEESIIGHYGKETKESNFPSHKIERNNGRKECVDLIQQKINALKAESEVEDGDNEASD